MNLTDEHIRMLAKAERDMSAGTVPYVKLGGQRLLIPPEAMEHFELESGQEITSAIHVAILQFNIALCQKKISDIEFDKLAETDIEVKI